MSFKYYRSRLFTLLITVTGLGCFFCGNAQTISTIAGTGNPGMAGDGGLAINAEIDEPYAIVLDESDNIYFTDYYKHVVRKISAVTGIITTVAGDGTMGFVGDGGPATDARLSSPDGLAIDGMGNLYIADHSNNRIRKVDQNGIITTFAGTGEDGGRGDGGPAKKAQLNGPVGLAFDREMNLLVADGDNNTVRKISKHGIISTIAGVWNGEGTVSGSFGGDGGLAVNASLNQPNSLTVDQSGNIYVSDCFNQRIRKITPKGIITTIAGTGTDGYNGDGKPSKNSQLNYPKSVVADKSGGVYVSDGRNHRIRYIAAKGAITTVAGTGEAGYEKDEQLATSAALNGPLGLALDKMGNLYVCDKGNNRIRKIEHLNPTGRAGGASVQMQKSDVPVENHAPAKSD